MKKNKFYVVWEGHNPGIYNSWEDCKVEINNYTSAKYKSFETLEEATIAFREGFQNYLGQKNNHSEQKKFMNLFGDNKPVLPSICVDAACSGNPGAMEFQGVETETGALLFKQGPYEQGTNNIGEFLAIAWALAILKKNNCNWPIYSDSHNAIKWVKEKKVNTKLERTAKNAKLFEIIDRAILWLKNNDYPNLILKWDTENWGEIPADFGRK
ncbi:ribonuclease H family protein [Bacteroidales bacterium OttesenSCG-928-K03]|nr:ribonuclease H family protein [Bacteroidales bacterium OttesenSCG-928-K22]MDL2242564.1 ribonuclease H family protein [Bacteroidales bacterium OttesenSCG-928-K03]